MAKVRFTGSCLSGGNSVVEIEDGEGFGLYMHQDSTTPVNIPYDIGSIRVSNHSVTIGERNQLHVVEHLFSALFGLSIYGVRIDVHGNEIPFFDGSSQDFVRSLVDLDYDRGLGVRPPNRVEVAAGNGSISYVPLETDDLIIEMSLTHPHIGTQKIVLNIDRDTYCKEVAPARTFVFTDDDDQRLRKLPPYGMGITGNRVYSTSPPRFPDEPVRHKLLDLLGDLYVLRKRLSGRITAVNTSHQLNVKFASELLRSLEGVHEKK
ncbi:MAG: UDP-3-O-acyl-N-acetylglucosamine deacetylase [candidate division WOR-3 bacterium]|nr:UDP-3-O-acyl-N-acetylglucosamine deacetylase [candidate division WOR-3 bacterium]